jgi:hypothetical protein
VSLAHFVTRTAINHLLLLISDGHPVFYYLTQSRKRVYADHAVQVWLTVPVSAVSPVFLKKFLPKWISRRVIIVWQSAIPPTICTFGISVLYGISQHLNPVRSFMVLLRCGRLTGVPPTSETSRDVVPNATGNDREALCSFTLLQHVRCTYFGARHVKYLIVGFAAMLVRCPLPAVSKSNLRRTCLRSLCLCSLGRATSRTMPLKSTNRSPMQIPSNV